MPMRSEGGTMVKTAGWASIERRSDGLASSVVKEIPAPHIKVNQWNAHWLFHA